MSSGKDGKDGKDIGGDDDLVKGARRENKHEKIMTIRI